MFTDLFEDEWGMLTECEAVTNVLAHFARIEVQREHNLASELLALLRLAFDRLYSNVLHPYELEALRTPMTTAGSLSRTTISAADLSVGATTRKRASQEEAI